MLDFLLFLFIISLLVSLSSRYIFEAIVWCPWISRLFGVQALRRWYTLLLVVFSCLAFCCWSLNFQLIVGFLKNLCVLVRNKCQRVWCSHKVVYYSHTYWNFQQIMDNKKANNMHHSSLVKENKKDGQFSQNLVRDKKIKKIDAGRS